MTIEIIMMLMMTMATTVNSATVTISPGDTIECSGFSSTSLPSALPTINSFCMDDPQCSELFGQSLGVNQPLFDHLFQTTTELSPPIFLETPLFNILCNKTVEDVNKLLWQKELRVSMAESEIVCGLNERHLFDVDTGELVCFPFPGREVRDPNAADGVVLTLMILLVISVLLKVGVDAWDSMTRWYNLRIKIRNLDKL